MANYTKLFGIIICLVITVYCAVVVAIQPNKAEQAYNTAKAKCEDQMYSAGYYNGSLKSAYFIGSACSKIASK